MAHRKAGVLNLPAVDLQKVHTMYLQAQAANTYHPDPTKFGNDGLNFLSGMNAGGATRFDSGTSAIVWYIEIFVDPAAVDPTLTLLRADNDAPMLFLDGSSAFNPNPFRGPFYAPGGFKITTTSGFCSFLCVWSIVADRGL